MIVLAILLTLINLPIILSQMIFVIFVLILSFAFASGALELYAYRIALGLDQMLNVFLLGFPDESISGRVGRAIATGRPRRGVVTAGKILDSIFLGLFDEVDHVKNAVEPEENFNERRELFKLYREGQ